MYNQVLAIFKKARRSLSLPAAFAQAKHSPRMLDNHLPKSRDTPFTPPLNAECPAWFHAGRERYQQNGKAPRYATRRAQTRTRAGWGGGWVSVWSTNGQTMQRFPIRWYR